MRRFGLHLLAALVAATALLSPAAAVAETRVALIIANSHYNLDTLKNPSADARIIAEALRKAGFDKVTVVEDVGRTAMNKALQNFGNDADHSDVAMVYYAGHGVEFDQVNYLIPTDAAFYHDRDIDIESVKLDTMLAVTQNAKRLRIIVLDACRENPFVTKLKKSSAAGPAIKALAEVEPGKDSVVVYSAKAGQLALDGVNNSPFAVALAQRLVEPGTEISSLLRNVKNDVLKQTGGQEPVIYGLPTSREFYFIAPVAVAAAPPVPTIDLESETYSLCKTSMSRGPCDAYLASYATGRFVPLVRVRIADLAHASEAAETMAANLAAARAASVAATNAANLAATYAATLAASSGGASGTPGVATRSASIGPAIGAPDAPVSTAGFLVAPATTAAPVLAAPVSAPVQQVAGPRPAPVAVATSTPVAAPPPVPVPVVTAAQIAVAAVPPPVVASGPVAVSPPVPAPRAQVAASIPAPSPTLVATPVSTPVPAPAAAVPPAPPPVQVAMLTPPPTPAPAPMAKVVPAPTPTPVAVVTPTPASVVVATPTPAPAPMVMAMPAPSPRPAAVIAQAPVPVVPVSARIGDLGITVRYDKVTKGILVDAIDRNAPLVAGKLFLGDLIIKIGSVVPDAAQPADAQLAASWKSDGRLKLLVKRGDAVQVVMILSN